MPIILETKLLQLQKSIFILLLFIFSKKYIPDYISKENNRDYQHTKRASNVKAYPSVSDYSRKNDTITRTEIADKTTLETQGAGPTGLNKIAYLMEKLQEKIALRVIRVFLLLNFKEKKVQLLQNEMSEKSDGERDFDDSK